MFFVSGALVFLAAFLALLLFGVPAMFAVILFGGVTWIVWVAQKG